MMDMQSSSANRRSIGPLVTGILLVAAFSTSAYAECGTAPAASALKPAVAHSGGFSGRFLKVDDERSWQSDPANIVGLWSVTLFGLQQGVDDHAIVTWHADGTELMNSSKPASTGNFCMGVWQQTGRRTYELNHFALEFPTIINIHEHIVLDPKGNRYTGTYTVDLIDANNPTGAPFATGIASGKIEGKRLTVF
jgi:hypothetical protein